MTSWADSVNINHFHEYFGEPKSNVVSAHADIRFVIYQLIEYFKVVTKKKAGDIHIHTCELHNERLMHLDVRKCQSQRWFSKFKSGNGSFRFIQL